MDGVEIKAIGIRLLLKVQTGVLLIYDRYPDFADDGLSGSRIEGDVYKRQIPSSPCY